MTQKFTAQEWAAMEGGHSIDDIESAEKPFSFIQDIYESRMTRTGGVKTLTYTDCCERAYLTLLIIELLRYFPTFKSDLQEYARSTTRHSGYGHYRTHATDLYNFIHFITGNDEDLDKLKDPEAAKKVREVTHFPAMAVNRYLSQIANSQQPLGSSDILFRVETTLNIKNNDYKSIRRFISTFRTSSRKDRRTYVTKLLIAARAKLRSSDIITYLEKLAQIRDLETDLVRDNEPTVSVPDLTTTGKDLSYYKYIVGTENIIMAKRFIDLAREGKSIPSQAVQGYLPAIKMIDDIVKGGPSYINLLRSLHQRAKKGLK